LGRQFNCRPNELHTMKTCTVNGIKLAFVDQGSGTVVLFVHGFPLDHSMWNGQIDMLSVRHRVIAPDLRGFGQSGVTESVVTMEQFADDLAALLDFLTIRQPVVLCGLSMGGYIAFEFWRKYAARLQGLILCDTRAANDTAEVAAGRLATAEKVLREGPRFIAETMIPKLFSPSTQQKRPDLLGSIRKVMDSTDPRGIAATARGMAQRANFTRDLLNIRCPALVLVGENDAISPVAEMEAIARAIPNARFTIIHDAGHLSPLEQPDAVNGAIESFLQEIRD